MSNPTRQWVITLAAVVMVFGTLAGFGVFGTRVEDSTGGAFSADATLLTPGTQAFSIWSLIYLGLFAYVVWQWTAPANPRARRIGLLVAGSMVLNALWLAVTQFGWVWASVVVILALAVDLGLLVQRLGEHSPASWVERLVVDGTFGVYLGWVSVASVANVTTALVSSGVRPASPAADLIAVAALILATALGSVYAYRLRARWAVAAAMGWALGWIAIARLSGPLHSDVTGIAALVAALGILAVTGLARRGAARPRRALLRPSATPATT